MDDVQTPLVRPARAGPEPGAETRASTPSRSAGSADVPRHADDEAKEVVPRRRKLTEEQEREVTRLYAETTTPVSEIRSRFGIAESSVYRVSQRHGAPLRGRMPATAKPVAPQARMPSTGARRRPSAESEAKTAVSAPQAESQVSGGKARAHAAPVATRRQVGERVAGASTRVAARGSKPSRQPTTLPRRATSAVGDGAKARFRIRFQVEALVEAVDISDAFRQAQSRGAIEVTAIVRED